MITFENVNNILESTTTSIQIWVFLMKLP